MKSFGKATAGRASREGDGQAHPNVMTPPRNRREPRICAETPGRAAAGRFQSRQHYRRYQDEVARRALLAILRRFDVGLAGKRVLDAGCGDAGMGDVWRGEGADVVGIDCDWKRLAPGTPGLVAGDVTALPFRAGAFDLVIAHDVVEHVKSTAMFLEELERVLAPGAAAFVTFPPFYGPYGGHQQGAGRPGRFMPYGHLLPRRLWLSVVGREAYEEMFSGLSRLSLSGFERLAATGALKVERRLVYLLRPEAALRFGVPAVQCAWLSRIAVLREFLAGGAYYLLRKAQ